MISSPMRSVSVHPKLWKMTQLCLFCQYLLIWSYQSPLIGPSLTLTSATLIASCRTVTLPTKFVWKSVDDLVEELKSVLTMYHLDRLVVWKVQMDHLDIDTTSRLSVIFFSCHTFIVRNSDPCLTREEQAAAAFHAFLAFSRYQFRLGLEPKQVLPRCEIYKDFMTFLLLLLSFPKFSSLYNHGERLLIWQE